MAVERVKEFTIDLGAIINARLESFSVSRKRIQATREAEFQRRIVDNDLSFQEQVDYYTELLKEERAKTYPDVNYINELETTISSTKKLVRARKFRDRYFGVLGDIVAGRKSLEDHITFLKDQLEEEWDREIKDEIQESLLKLEQQKRDTDRSIINSQISFYAKDKTLSSINSAMELTKSQLNTAIRERNNELINAYELKLRSLDKAKIEIDIEDKANFLIKSLISTDRPNNSLFKLDAFSDAQSRGNTTMPITMNTTRYNSEADYWGTTLGNYISGDFAKEFIGEEISKMKITYGMTGQLPDVNLRGIVNEVRSLRNKQELAPYAQVITAITQDVFAEALRFKAAEITSRYALDSEVSTTKDYAAGIKELEDLQTIFGADYSLIPEIQAVRTKLDEKNAEILRVGKSMIAAGYTLEEAKAGIKEIEREELKTKPPFQILEETIAKAKKEVPPEEKPPVVEKPPVTEKPPVEEKPPIEEKPPVTPTLTTYKIESGDNLTKIAKQFGTTVDAIMAANVGNPAIKSRNLIIAGKNINIPTIPASPEVEKPKIKISPETGEVITPLTPPPPSEEVFPLTIEPPYIAPKEKGKISPEGQYIPPGSYYDQTTKTIKKYPEGSISPAPPKSTPTSTVSPKIVTVGAGETLWGIAQRELGAGARWKELKTPGGKTFTEAEARRLKIGQQLIIPPK